MSNPACWRSPTSERLPVMEYGLHSPITSFVASLSFESRLQAIPWSTCVWREMGKEGVCRHIDKEVVYYRQYACVRCIMCMQISLVPRPLPDFISQPWRKISTAAQRGKIWEWPGDEATCRSCSAPPLNSNPRPSWNADSAPLVFAR